MAAVSMRITQRVVLLAWMGVWMSAWVDAALADTLEGYQNSTTRQQIERMDENARANARDTPNTPSTGIQGSALEGQLNRLRAEEEAAREKKAADKARQRRELEAWSAEYDARQKEIAASTSAANALEYAREQQELAAKRAAMTAYVQSLPSDAPIGIADYDRLLDIAAPLLEAMLPIMQSAYRDYPQAFELRHAFLQLSSCPGLRSAATAFYFKTHDDAERRIRAACKAQQLSAAMPSLEKASRLTDKQDAVLACALMAGAYAGLANHEVNGMETFDNEVMRPRMAAWLEKRLSPCATLAPPGSPLYVGLIEPLVRDAERTDDDRLNVTVHHLWPLVARTSWAGVDINNADTVRRVYNRATALKPAASPGAARSSEYFIWFNDFPQVKLLELKPGVDTPDSVMTALGKPVGTVVRETLDVVPGIRQACRVSSFQHQLPDVLRYEGDASFKRFGSRRRMDQVVHVFFDGSGRLCAAEVTRNWVLPGAYASVIGIFLNGPGGWNDSRWRETRHQFR